MEDTYLPAMRCPAYRGHDSYPGFRMELENRVDDGKGLCQEDAKASCCTGDEGGPFGAAL